MQDRILLAVFIALPLVDAVLLMAFFRRKARRSGSGASGRRLVVGNALVLLMVLSLALLGGEVYFRFFYDTTESFGLTRTTADWFGRYYQFNKSGVRDSLERYVAPLRPGLRRITFVGDSFTAGHGIKDVEHRFANIVRREKPAWEVHVFASNGWDTGEELAMLQNLVQRNNYGLDVVVLVYNLNDIADIVPEWQAILGRIYGGPKPGFLIKHSYLINMLYYRWKAAHDPDIANYYRFVGAAYSGPLWEKQKERFRLFNSFIQAQGGRLVSVTFPFLQDQKAGDPYAAAHASLDAFWRDLGVAHLDLSGLFKLQKASSLVVNRHDSHPNERAHSLAAEAILRFLDPLPTRIP